MRVHTTKSTAVAVILLTVGLLVSGFADAFAQRGPGAERGENRPGLPSVDAMAEAVGADAEERAALAEARLALLESRGPGRRGAGASPVMEFLVDVAPSFETEEMIALVDLFSTSTRGRRGDGPGRGRGQEGRAGMQRGRGHHGPGAEDRLILQLDLTEDQRDEVEALYATTIGALRGLRSRVAPGEEAGDALRAEADRIRATHQTRLAEILSDEQESELETLRARRRALLREIHGLFARYADFSAVAPVES